MPQLGLGNLLSKSSGSLSGYSLNFDGTNDYVDCGTGITDITSGACTVSGWYKIKAGYDVADGNLTFFGRGVGSSTSGYTLKYEDSGGTKRMMLFQTKSGGYNYIAHNVTLSTGAWHHIVWVNGGTGVASSFYINGTQVVTKTHSQDIVSASSISFKIGINEAANQHWAGNIDEVAFWNTALDADAITAIYNSGTPISLSSDSGDYDNSSNLQGWWRMGDGTEEASGTTIYDMSTNSNNGTMTNMDATTDYEKDTP